MKLGRRKKYDPSSSTATSIIGSVFPVSWISKFRKKGGNPEDSVKEKQRGKVDFPTPNSAGWREGRFYSMDEDDAYWRLSFTEERIEGRRSTGGLMNPLWYDSGDDAQVSIPSFKSFSLREVEVQGIEENWNFNNMVLDIKKMKEKELEKGNLREDDDLRRRKEKAVKDHQLRKPSRGSSRVKEAEFKRIQDEEKEVKTLRSSGNYMFEIEQDNMVDMGEEFPESIVPNSRKQHNVSFPNLDLSSIEEDCEFHCLDVDKNSETSEKVPILEWQNLENRRMKEIKTEKGSQWKSAYQKDGFKVYSPTAECKIRATEDMTKSRTSLKKKATKDQMVESGTMFDCYAVVKSSFNPQRDFRDSMIEMMIEQDVRQPEELEDLLACYLTFNRDEYHDVIIKVFRQAWFELNGGFQCS